ncbi:uncharacterized protein BDR25DRAFT_353846 [Lindgomyces ingoldianus]|uniref:Uncharacterized protein n=1 Tax=Lindgomyces ingoldianus TaxID=673940 RepID=A0ACB6R0R5_9PLEO|nr:uncharacterized protein BDR25DRAFT_353846 [Lindgomyces ingoldianus]KAF2472107.1 hypothetical protein BDR25DRAFT_353846 [Lindgomyces ingoldianus]
MLAHATHRTNSPKTMPLRRRHKQACLLLRALFNFDSTSQNNSRKLASTIHAPCSRLAALAANLPAQVSILVVYYIRRSATVGFKVASQVSDIPEEWRSRLRLLFTYPLG